MRRDKIASVAVRISAPANREDCVQTCPERMQGVAGVFCVFLKKKEFIV